MRAPVSMSGTRIVSLCFKALICHSLGCPPACGSSLDFTQKAGIKPACVAMCWEVLRAYTASTSLIQPYSSMRDVFASCLGRELSPNDIGAGAAPSSTISQCRSIPHTVMRRRERISWRNKLLLLFHTLSKCELKYFGVDLGKLVLIHLKTKLLNVVVELR